MYTSSGAARLLLHPGMNFSIAWVMVVGPAERPYDPLFCRRVLLPGQAPAFHCFRPGTCGHCEMSVQSPYMPRSPSRLQKGGRMPRRRTRCPCSKLASTSASPRRTWSGRRTRSRSGLPSLPPARTRPPLPSYPGDDDAGAWARIPHASACCRRPRRTPGRTPASGRPSVPPAGMLFRSRVSRSLPST